jgi:hypothetical protein
MMGECGCTVGNKAYKLKAPDGWYVFQMDPGCDYCDVGPGIRISMPGTSKLYFDDGELEEIPTLPTMGKNSEAMAVIDCGIPRGTMANAAIKLFTGCEVEGNTIDEYLAEVLGEDLWGEVMNRSPKVIYPNEN